MDTREQLFAERVIAFLRRTGNPTRFGRNVTGDPNLIRQIERGRSPTLRTADRILTFITHYDPGGRGDWDPPWPPRRPTVWPRTKHRLAEIPVASTTRSSRPSTAASFAEAEVHLDAGGAAHC